MFCGIRIELEMSRQELNHIFNNLDGQRWILKENWISSKPLSSWTGINKNNNDPSDEYDTVYSLNLCQNNLNG